MDCHTAAQLESLHPDAFGWALHCMAGDHARAQDVLQNAYLKLAQGRARFNGASAFKTWWFGVIRFTALEEMRRSRQRDTLLGRLLSMFREDHHPAPSRQLEAAEAHAALRRCLQELPARQAEVLHLVFYQDLTIQQAAQVMGVGLGSARQHYERGKARLRALLPPESAHEPAAR